MLVEKLTGLGLSSVYQAGGDIESLLGRTPAIRCSAHECLDFQEAPH
jgi:hypothetical protein